MPIYKVLFQPLSGYFFGEDGSFRSGIENAEYYISSKEFPSQTTLFGILRYLNLEHKKDWGSYNQEEIKENEEMVGKRGFSIENAIDSKNEDQNEDFGKIKKMSSVFINEDNIKEKINRIYIPIPKDSDPKEDKKYMSIMSKGYTVIKTIHGFKWIPSEYDAKQEIKKSFISIDSGISNNKIVDGDLSIIDSIFEHRIKGAIKINRNVNSDEPVSSLFKKGYVYLKQLHREKHYSFGVYVEIEGDCEKIKTKLNTIVTMGLGATPFKVTAKIISDSKEESRIDSDLKLNLDRVFKEHAMRGNIIYCISPCFIENPQDILEKCVFSSIDVTAVRQLTSNGFNKKIKKEETLYNLLDAGSILMIEDTNKDILIDSFSFKKMQQIGYNHYYVGGKK
jgi:hypothetical protein